jgi:hypothetical protein
VLRQLAALKPQLYVVDARKVAEDVGLGKRINMVMQTVFFNLSGVVPMEKVRCGAYWGAWCSTAAARSCFAAVCCAHGRRTSRIAMILPMATCMWGIVRHTVQRISIQELLAHRPVLEA